MAINVTTKKKVKSTTSKVAKPSTKMKGTTSKEKKNLKRMAAARRTTLRAAHKEGEVLVIVAPCQRGYLFDLGIKP